MLKIRFTSVKLSLLSVILIIGFSNVFCTTNDYYSSSLSSPMAMAGYESLLNTEARLLDVLQNYVNEVSDHIEALRSEIEVLRAEHLLASQNLNDFLINPISSYRLIKRLQNDWAAIEETVRQDVSAKNYLAAMDMQRQNLSFPTQNDVHDVVVALAKLQDSHKLDVAQLASGMLNGIKTGSPMSWQDCFLLGHHLFEVQDFNHTIPWLKHSMKMLSTQTYNEDPISLEFMTAAAAYHQEMGDFETALGLIQNVLAIDPTREANLQEIKVYLENMITMESIHEVATPAQEQQQLDYHQTNEFKLYEKVCNDEISITLTQQRPLRCRYYTNNVAYRLLQPFKMEELFLEPYIVQYHDVIRTKQMDVLKQLATPKMSRSQVLPFNETDEVIADYRTSLSAWFQYHIHPYMREMQQIVTDFSGLEMTNVEELQIANYGVGGLYEPHYDFFSDLASDDIQMQGNRFATALFYISDVEEGGGTAFPHLPILVQPLRGSVLFWYNLHRSEEPDYRTKHGACPVRRGYKWIANIWVRVRGQEFTHPCALQPDHDKSLKFKDLD